MTVFGYALSPGSVPCGAAGVELTLKVSNETGSAQECKAIQFTLPAGLSGDLGAVGAAALSGTPWSITSEGDGVFQAEPQPPATGIGAGDAIGFTFSGIQASATPANLELAVAEASGGGTDLPLTLAAAQFGITQFTASALQVAHDTPVTLSWNASEATGCSLSWAGSHYDGPAHGSHTDSPTVTTTYTLTASGTGEPVQAQITVTVATPQVISFGGTPVNVAMGGDVVLTWEAIHAARCTLTFFPPPGVPQPPVIELPPQSGGLVVNPDISGNYHFDAIGEGRTVSQDQPVTVEDVVIDSFEATPATPDPVGNWNLSWGTRWTTACAIDNGVGTVPAAGTRAVSSDADTTYKLTASGFAPRSATARTFAVPRILAFSILIDVPWRRQPAIVVAWQSSGAATGTLGGGPVGTNGSVTLGPGRGDVQQDTLALTSSLGASAAVAFTVNRGISGGNSLSCTAPGGINLPGPMTLAWSDADEAPGTVVAAGHELPYGGNRAGTFQFAVSEPPGAPPFWSVSLGDEQLWWSIAWQVAFNSVPVDR